jgi:outer membrane immunogenic protein
MLRSVSLVALLLASSAASAADMDGSMLRGDLPMEGSAWAGTYLGGMVSYNNLEGEVAGQSVEDVRYELKGTATLSELKPDELVEGFMREKSGLGYGGVIGHNWDWDGVIFGLEAGYQYLGMNIEAERQTIHIYKEAGETPAGVPTYMNAQVRYGGEVHYKDMVNLKGRLGYDAGNFMPFLSFGAAVFRADTSHYTWIASGDTVGQPAVSFPSKPQYRKTTKNDFGFGLTGGIGVEYMLAPGLSVRGEYEITRVDELGGGRHDLETFRTGITTKF